MELITSVLRLANQVDGKRGRVDTVVAALELLTPQPDLVASDTYNKFFTMHGVIMVFLFLVPSVPATLGNFLIPIMLGARDLALGSPQGGRGRG